MANDLSHEHGNDGNGKHQACSLQLAKRSRPSAIHCLNPSRQPMSKDNSPPFRKARSIASHLDIDVDPNNPPPIVSQAFIDVRQHVDSLWTKFETAEESLVPLDDKINQEIRKWLLVHPKATALEIRMERARITLRLYVPCIEEADTCWSDLKEGMKLLEEAAKKEAETIEGRATTEIDLKVMNDNLATVEQIIECAKAQLGKAKALLESDG